MGRAPCCDKANVKRGPWSPEEDEALRNYIHKNGSPGNWISLPHKAGLKRCGKSCRLRWLNYLRPHIKRGSFTEEEDNIIVSLYGNIGSRWSVIAAKLPGRTDNDVKNHWNTKLKKKLFGGGDKKMANHGANNNTSSTKISSNTNPNALEDYSNHNISTGQTQQHLYLPSFSYLLAQGNYNSSPLEHTGPLLFDQFMFSSPVDAHREQSSHEAVQLVSADQSQEARSITISGPSLSPITDQVNNYLAYPCHGSNVENDHLLLEDTGLGFEPFMPSEDLKDSINPSYVHG